MTSLSEDELADLARRIAELEEQLRSAAAERDAAVERQTAATLEQFRLETELHAALDRQKASAEILRSIGATSGDAGYALRQIAETAAHFFNAPSVTIRIAEGDRWVQDIRVGGGSLASGAHPGSPLIARGASLPATVYRENRQIHIPDLDNIDPSMAHWPAVATRAVGIRTISGTPLRREGKAIGALIIYRDRLAPFTDEELALQQSFADQAVIAIENARLFNETQEALERQTATSDILRVINNSTGNLAPVFESILEKAHHLCGAPCGSLQLYDAGRVVSVAIRGMTDAFAEYLRAGYPITESVRGALFADRPIQIPDVTEFLRSRSDEPSFRAAVELGGIGTMLTVPLAKDGTVFGRIVAGRQEVRAFTDKQIALLQGFADQAVIAIENARLFNETREALERQTATADILKVIASSPSDVQPVFEAIAARAKSLVGGFSSTVFRFIDGMAHLEAFTPTTPEADKFLRSTFPRPVEEFAPFRMTQIGEVMQIPDTEALTDDILDISRARGFRSMVFAPLMNKGTSIGFIAVTRVQPGSFTDHHVQVLQTFADQAVIAIENARLFDEVQAKTRDLEESLQQQTATADVLKVISRSAFDLQTVLDTLVSSAARLCEAEMAFIMRRDGDLYRAGAAVGFTDEYIKFLEDHPITPNRGTMTGRAALGRRAVQIPDVAADPEYTMRESTMMAGQRTALGVPLLRENEPIGVIVIARKRVQEFTEKQIELVSTFADQAVIAIENVRLFEEVRAKTRDLEESLQQQTATADVLKVISRSAFDLQAVLDTLVESAVTLSGARSGTIFQKRGELYHLTAAHGYTPEMLEYGHAHPLAPGIGSNVGRAALTAAVVQIPDTLADPDYTASGYQRVGGFRAMLGIPFMRDGKVEGVFSLARPEPGLFAPRQVELVKTFADQAAIAIENVRLFDEVQARTRELAKSLDDLRTAQDRLIQTEKLASLGQLTAGIAHEIKNPLNFVNNFSALSVELTDELNDLLKQATLADKLRGEVDELTTLLKDNLGKVVQHGKRADSIVKNMLLHSREGSGERRPADINALVDESLNLAYHGARAEKPQFNVTLQRDFDPDAGMIELFPQEITRVLLNMITNGFYAVTKRKTDNGGAGFEPLVTASTRGLSDHVEIRIRDNGTGIPTDVKEKMFNPFFTTKPAGEGTGLGLSMSHDIIVKQHGGTIDVDTEPGVFTEFTIVLPRHKK